MRKYTERIRNASTRTWREIAAAASFTGERDRVSKAKATKEAMATDGEITRLLNLRGQDNSVLAEVFKEYFGDRAQGSNASGEEDFLDTGKVPPTLA